MSISPFTLTVNSWRFAALSVSRIVRYKNAVLKVEEIGGEIKRNFGGDFPFRVKRMAKDHFNTSEAKKCLDFGDTPSAASPGTPTNLHVGETSAEINIDPGRGIGLSPIPFGGREATTGNASALRRLWQTSRLTVWV